MDQSLEPIALLTPELQALLKSDARWRTTQTKNQFRQTRFHKGVQEDFLYEEKELTEVDPLLPTLLRKLMKDFVVMNNLLVMNIACARHARTWDVEKDDVAERYFLHRMLSIKESAMGTISRALVTLNTYAGPNAPETLYKKRVPREKALIMSMREFGTLLRWEDVETLFPHAQQRVAHMTAMGFSPQECALELEQQRPNHHVDASLDMPTW